MFWLATGERNTSFFPKAAVERTHSNFIAKIKRPSGEWLSSQEEVREEAISYFSSVLSKDQVDRSEAQEEILGEISNLISERDNSFVVKPISLEELEETVLRMEDKAPGLDGFQINFFKSSWDIIKGDLLKYCEESRKLGKVLGRLNATFITLISKEKGPSTFDRFRPISLYNICYKIITKLMANILKQILPKLILEE
eukprot:Gb_01141 [translate_table: standard]